MLHDFVTSNTAELVARAKKKALKRPWPPPSPEEVENGIPLFLSQLSQALRREQIGPPVPDGEMAATADEHGRELLQMGFTVSQVVHDYGDVCQAITELAIEQKSPISSEEFHTLNRCLDDAIAHSVTSYGKLKEEATAHLEVERLGRLAHELRNGLQTALLSFQVLKTGAVGMGGSTGAVLGRTLIGLSEVIDGALAEVRLSATEPRRDRVSLLVFVDEVAVAAQLHAEYRGIQLTVHAVDPSLAIDVDPQLLSSALMNLLQNAFKFTHPKGHVAIRTRAEKGRVFIEVEDECGGLKGAGAGSSGSSGDPEGVDHSGLGLGLTISQKAVAANGGEIHNRTLAGKGCVFTIELPQALPQAA